jgi:hypothetical protein
MLFQISCRHAAQAAGLFSGMGFARPASYEGIPDGDHEVIAAMGTAISARGRLLTVKR